MFCGIPSPDKKGLIASFESSHNNLTGMASCHTSYAPNISHLLQIKPHTKNVLIVHNSLEPWLQKNVALIHKNFENYDVEVKNAEITHPDELEKTITPLLSQVDTIFTLRDNIVIAGIKTLVKLCNNNGITLFCPEYYSSLEGAAVGYGANEKITGVQSAEKALLILENEKEPSEIPITTPNHTFKLAINRRTMLQQGVLFLFPSDKRS